MLNIWAQPPVIKTPDERFNFSFYKGFEWYYKNSPEEKGQIRPLNHVGEIVYHLMDGDAVLVGVEEQGSGHTYLVTGAEFVPDFRPSGINEVNISAATKIMSIRLLDPSNPSKPEAWSSDMEKFFSNLRFGLIFTDPRST